MRCCFETSHAFLQCIPTRWHLECQLLHLDSQEMLFACCLGHLAVCTNLCAALHVAFHHNSAAKATALHCCQTLALFQASLRCLLVLYNTPLHGCTTAAPHLAVTLSQAVIRPCICSNTLACAVLWCAGATVGPTTAAAPAV